MRAPYSLQRAHRGNRLRAVGTTLALALCWELGAVAGAADQRYVVSGRDSFVIGAADIRSETEYRGVQTLSVTRHGRLLRFKARVKYVRSDQGASTGASADFVTDTNAAGDPVASADHDPDYLTVLNQPFAAQLDAATLADLRKVRGTVPFDFPSPITGGALHGRLERIGEAVIGGRRSIGVRLRAGGPMKGALPDRPALNLNGAIVMSGSAYYDLETALLLSLEATVTIAGNVSNRAGNDRVTIQYQRSIRADVPPATSTAERAR